MSKMSAFRDEAGCFGQLQWDGTMDYGDSAHFTGLYIMATGDKYPWLWFEFTNPKGQCRRYPNESPWDNPKNFTRDQLMPLVAGLMAQNSKNSCRKVFWSHFRRFFLCQNIERDCPGTTKYLWPHRARRCKGKDEFEKTIGHWKVMDYRDPLFPHHIAALYFAAGFKGKKIVKALAMPFLFMDLLIAKLRKSEDLGECLATCAILGEINLFKKVIPDWEQRLSNYFMGWRQQGVIFDRLRSFILFSRGV